MVDVFLRKMRLQVEKHNKQYILTQGIVSAVFAEWQTGQQAVAQALKGGAGLPSLSPPFFSKQHDQDIDCEKFQSFSQTKYLSPCWSNSEPILLSF
jgi:hypothetical protein